MNPPTQVHIIIDAKDQILGRFATHAAKAALCGVKVSIINCEKAYLSGSAFNLNARYRARRERGEPRNGPFFPRHPDRFVKRTIRGMLPWDKTRGREAYKRVLCYIGFPAGFENEKPVDVAGSHASKLTTVKYISVREIATQVGSKV